jgi:hypothetical protein
VSEILCKNPSYDLAIRFIADPSSDPCRYNPPTVDEIAAIIPRDDMEIVRPCNILLHTHDGAVRHISNLHASYAPLHYVLLFPYGINGWTQTLEQHLLADARYHTCLSQLQFYTFRIHTHLNEFPIIHHAGRLFQQFLCDMWVSTDQN